MKVIGLCGGSGSGKGLACRFFAQFGIKIIDTDGIYHTLTSTAGDCLQEIENAFGTSVIKDGALDRRLLANIVFSSPDKLSLLNSITHKHILNEARRRIDAFRENGAIGVIIDAPLLFESGFDKECDATVAICADTDIRILRITQRDGISREHAVRRIQSQKSDEWLRGKCDYVIENNGTFADLERSVMNLTKKIFDI